MKSKTVLCVFLTVFLFAGCSLFPSSPDDPSRLKLGSSVEINNIDSSFTLLDNMDVLASDGLYYAFWGIGGNEPYENSNGKTVDLYDAQLYFLLGEYRGGEAAQENMDSWLAVGRANYEVLSDEEVTCGGQTYSLLTYNFKNEGSPYAKGVSAFGVSGSSAVCIELTARENFEGDLETILTDFLNNCSYTTD